MSDILLFTTRAVHQIDSIINAVTQFIFYFFRQEGFVKQLVTTIVNSDYLLVSLSLVFLGFVIGLIGRLIRN